ncbi:hypothetical protein ALP33_200038 [Pseudomonas amygdali pv. lachrymans]|uniref:Uncharacterized protein n=2 Tax=Pseudomonas amygdali pv. lachrymans TaxID=53707 RepID=A0AB37R1F5_PSEAV|nr:hypothetical protein ALQ79_01887 [Pseudomonas amygdali pv. lachrymans]RMU13198.1 hypothetical protein ALP33_200038 [Pseudomonas amygdali pv. lachrymans]
MTSSHGGGRIPSGIPAQRYMLVWLCIKWERHQQPMPDWTVEGGVPEITRQLDLNDSLAEVSGCMFFRHMFLRASQTQQVVDYLKLRWADV